MPHRLESVEQPAGQAYDARMNRFHPDRHQMSQSDFDRRKAEVIDGAILKGSCPIRHDMPISLHRHHIDGTTGEPGALQVRECGFSYQQAPHACRIATHLVERNRHKIGMPPGEIEPVARNK